MLIYLLAFVGGILTILSPCILPVLPFVFARADQPFRRSGLPLLGGMALGIDGVDDISIRLLAGLFLLGLFACCMVCHGELTLLKPHPRYLTHFYLMISAGGALGGLLVGFVAPKTHAIFVRSTSRRSRLRRGYKFASK